MVQIRDSEACAAPNRQDVNTDVSAPQGASRCGLSDCERTKIEGEKSFRISGLFRCIRRKRTVVSNPWQRNGQRKTRRRQRKEMQEVEINGNNEMRKTNSFIAETLVCKNEQNLYKLRGERNVGTTGKR
jgi:hypothetical protein